eukprot:CAMPEP_0174359394 /NCGR_PEP_ID=MMETSP0811_2-20130205/48451_1 /TAXON_ID=73025 ORGANISM="Eutreptiella gymnastica-like, Strain CCMP1594" /NCGR_SAMPLE_ID=MMETSP0811_2 /ASSEMBLY_ACC=CAM_ASM_000667 /LENGTH=35 /DNA_ID= /DNA_START= /DNA_END= /DNA_ORIENTATION=
MDLAHPLRKMQRAQRLLSAFDGGGYGDNHDDLRAY